jgi:hypothetical protein
VVTHRNSSLDGATIDRVACEVRLQVDPDASPHDRVALSPVRGRLIVEGLCGRFDVSGGMMAALPNHIWGLTCFGAGRAMVWFHRTAWIELAAEVERSRWSAGHELGHLSVHAHDLRRTGDSSETPKMEREANLFCAHLLIPDAAIHRLWSQRNGSPLPADLATRFGCSVVAAERRVEEFRTSA